MARRRRALLALLATAPASAGAAARFTAAWTLEQAAGTSPWAAWSYFPAGVVTVPPEWVDPIVSWTFTGAADAWYAGQASLGVDACYVGVAPTSANMSANAAGGPCAASVGSHSVGFWLYNTAAVLGGRWRVAVEYGLSLAPPPAAAAARLPPPASPPPPRAFPAPAGTSVGAWAVVAGAGCVAGDAMALACEAGVVLTTGRPVDNLAQTLLPVVPDARGGSLAVFMMQAQTFSRRGFPAPLSVVDGAGALLWSADLPVTPGGESCQDGGSDCPSSITGGLAQAPRPTSFALSLAPTVGPYSMRMGFAPNTLNTWGAAGGVGCGAAAALHPCWQYGPSVSLAASAVRTLWAPRAAAAAAGALAPILWTGSWPNASTGFASGAGDAAALMVAGCSNATAAAQLGWTGGGAVTAAYDVATAHDDDGSASVAAALWMGSTAFAVGATVPAGPLELRLTLGRGICGDAWSRVLVSGVAVTVTPPPAPQGAFVIQRSTGSCLRGMQPLRV